uniref:Claudin-34 n=1 Tax=Gouania willdenowi TaxID=441366 RepID=A0A8C5DRF6_GOUWI
MVLEVRTHCQFLGLIVGFLAWILTLTTAGLNEWRLWYVSDKSVVTSGVAWVGIWRTCFYSHAMPKIENCQSISVSADFLPVEIPVAQVLMTLAVICGLGGNIGGALAMRMAYFSVDDRRSIRLHFVLAGLLYLLTATLSLVPLVWNMTSVLNNSTIDFPPEFQLPAAPVSQKIGSAIGVGMMASIMMLLSGMVFLCYQYVWHTVRSESPTDPMNSSLVATALSHPSETFKHDRSRGGVDNPAFHIEEIS